MTTDSKEFLSFLIILVIVQPISSYLFPLYDENQGNNTFFDINKSFILSCKVSENYESANEITWGRQHLDNSTTNLDLTKYEIKHTIDMCSLIIHTARKEDAGVYFCEYMNKTFNFNVIARLRVKVRPSTDLCVVEGDVLMLKCVGVGTKIHLKWVFDGRINDVKYIKRIGDSFESNTLVIKKAEKWHSGNFTCVGRHNESLGLDTVVKITIHVRIRDSYAGMFNVLKWPSSCTVFFMSKGSKELLTSPI